jgi:hypothetical protein
MDNLHERTPVEIDTRLAELHSENARLSRRFHDALDAIHRELGDKKEPFLGGYAERWGMAEQEAFEAATVLAQSGTPNKPWVARQMVRLLIDRAAALDALRPVVEEIDALGREFYRRPWTRAFLCVTSGQGHVHSGRDCSTCRATTLFNWRTELSGAPESEIVEKAGERACTVCYPSAPVETRSRPTQLFTPEEVAAQAERERRRALGPKPTCPICEQDRPRTKATARGERIPCSECVYRQEQVDFYRGMVKSGRQDKVDDLEQAERELERRRARGEQRRMVRA